MLGPQGEDDQDKFSQLQQDVLPEGPESISFYNAKVKREQKVPGSRLQAVGLGTSTPSTQLPTRGREERPAGASHPEAGVPSGSSPQAVVGLGPAVSTDHSCESPCVRGLRAQSGHLHPDGRCWCCVVCPGHP